MNKSTETFSSDRLPFITSLSGGWGFRSKRPGGRLWHREITAKSNPDFLVST